MNTSPPAPFHLWRGEKYSLRCVTAPVNKTSIAFHLRMGFEAEPQPTAMDGVPYAQDYDGPGGDRVLLVKRLE